MKSCLEEYGDNLSFIYLNTNKPAPNIIKVITYTCIILLKVYFCYNIWYIATYIWYQWRYYKKYRKLIYDSYFPISQIRVSSCHFNFENHSSVFLLAAFNISTMLTMISRILVMTTPSTIWSTTIFNAIAGIWKRWIPRNWIKILFFSEELVLEHW